MVHKWQSWNVNTRPPMPDLLLSPLCLLPEFQMFTLELRTKPGHVEEEKSGDYIWLSENNSELVLYWLNRYWVPTRCQALSPLRSTKSDGKYKHINRELYGNMLNPVMAAQELWAYRWGFICWMHELRTNLVKFLATLSRASSVI